MPFNLVSTTLLVVANLLVPLAIMIFASGFFPYKSFIPGRAHFEAEQVQFATRSPFDKVIFMVVDALRRFALAKVIFPTQTNGLVILYILTNLTSFILRGIFLRGPHLVPCLWLTYTSRLIRSGAALPFTAHAMSPTITMPRVKAITTGSVPSFLDVILNFAESDKSSTLATQDTWPAQLAALPGGKLLMYGDDTWLKLFPNTFSRADGASSFFVSVSTFLWVRCNVAQVVAAERSMLGFY